MLVYSFFHVIGPTRYGLVSNVPKKFAAKSSVERAWQTTVNKDSTMIQNQRPNSNDRDWNVYFAFLQMVLRQRQDTIHVMLEYHARSRTRARKKEGTRSHT